MTEAEVQIPAGYVFAGAHDTRLLMEALQNPTSGNELGFMAPAMRETVCCIRHLGWQAVEGNGAQ